MQVEMIIAVSALCNCCETEWLGSGLQVPGSICYKSCSSIQGQAIRVSEEDTFGMSSLLGPKTHSDFPCFTFPLRILCAFVLSFLFSLLGLSHKERTLLFSSVQH